MTQTLFEGKSLGSAGAGDRLSATAMTVGAILHSHGVYPELFSTASDQLSNMPENGTLTNLYTVTKKQKIINLGLATGVTLKATGSYEDKFAQATDILEKAAEVSETIDIDVGGVLLMLGLPDIGNETCDNQKKYDGFQRGSRLLEKAYPNGNTNTWGRTYMHLSLYCATELFRQKTDTSSLPLDQIHLPRLKLWLAGEKETDIAFAASSTYGAIHSWQHQLPNTLRKYVNYYDLVHVTDSLYWAVNPDGLDTIARV